MRSRTFIATPPGATIREQLDDRGMSQKEFAVRMDLSEKHISKLINGDVQLTPEVAVRLEIVLGTPANFWNRLEAVYREKLIKAKAENDMEEDVALVKQFPYQEMSKFGWVPETRDFKERVAHLRKYFEVVQLALLGNEQLVKIACRRLAITEKGDLALLAWVQEAKIRARDIKTAPVNMKKLLSVIPEIRQMTLQKPEEFCPVLQEMLAQCGIALVFLPHLKGSFLQGASFMDGNKIVLGLTARGKDADKFWFSLFHELGHIILGHISLPEGTSKEDEENADNWSRDALIPLKYYYAFMNSRNYTESSVCSFAKEIGVAPGIVVGRLQNEGLVKHSMMNDLKEHYVIAC